MSLPTHQKPQEEIKLGPCSTKSSESGPDPPHPHHLPASQASEVPASDPEKHGNLAVQTDPNLKRDDHNEAPNYPGPFALALLTLGICLSAFIVALDRTIVATAIPQITDDFHTPGDVGWYGSAYLLTSCAFQPIYGRVFKHFDVRWSFIGALGLFERGSLICGVAPNSVALIVGRAIAGLGCAGVFAGVLVIVTLSVPLAKRPVYIALVGSTCVFMLSHTDGICGC